MATTQNLFNGNGSTTEFTYTFPTLKDADVKAEVDNVLTTAFTLLTSPTRVKFNTAPASGTGNVRVFRDTEVDAAKAVFASGSSIRATDLNNNFDQLLYATQEEQAATITTHRIADSAILSSHIKDDQIVNADINSAAEIAVSKLADGAARQVLQTAADGTTVEWTSNVDVPGTLDVTGATTLDGGLEVVLGTTFQDSVTINADNKRFEIQNNSGTEKFKVDTDNGNTTIAGTLDVTGTTTLNADLDLQDNDKIKIGTGDDLQIYHNGTNSLINNGTGSLFIQGGGGHVYIQAVDDENGVKIYPNGQVECYYDDSKKFETTSAGAKVTGDLEVTGSFNLGSASIGTGEIADEAVTLAKIEDITNSQLIVGNVSNRPTAVAMSGDITIAASGATTIGANTVEIGMLGCEETTLTSNSDTKIPTSKAVADYVSNQVTPLGGFEAIDDEDSFPATQPAAGVIVSIKDATGITVDNASPAKSTNCRTTGSGSDNVTISGFPDSLKGGATVDGTTNANPFPLPNSTGLLCISTGSGHNYTFHRLLATSADIRRLSDDVNDFFARYRIAASAPSSNNDDGDLYWDTNAKKMKVYDAGTSTWGDVASSSDSYVATLSPAFDGSETEFTASTAPQNAASTIVSINGVIQKPNNGTTISGSGEGFCITSASKIKFATAPASGDSVFVVILGDTVSIGTPSDNTITSAKIVDGAIANVDIGDDQIKEVKLDISNAPSDGQFLQYKDSTDQLTWAAASSTPTTTRGDIIYRGASADVRLAKGSAGQVLKMGANDPEWGSDSYTSVLTTQGDVLYRDGSGDQRLPKGTAGQALIMNSGATAPEWGAAGATIANDANNRVITADGSAGLNGEANLTFDGSTLALTGAATVSTTLGVTGVATITSQTISRGYECPATVAANWSIGANNNALFPGPMTVASGVTVTVPANRTLTVV